MVVILIIRTLLVVYLSQVTVAKSVLQCRAIGIYWNVRIYCPCDQIIHIRSAFVGFSRQPCRPPMETLCISAVTNKAPMMNCNRSTSCTIPGNFLHYQTYDEQCRKPENGSFVNFINITYDCINPVVVPRKTVQCQSNKPFKIERCPCSQVIHIQSAEVGFTKQCSSLQPTCSSLANHPSIMGCNWKPSCNINQNVLYYTPTLYSCDRRQDTGFINIVYNCINKFNVHVCRAADEKHIYMIDKCRLSGQVFYIHAALVSFSHQYNATDDTPKCGESRACSMPTRHYEIMRCNGRPVCSFSQDVFNFSYTAQKCSWSTEGNRIIIIYSCIDDHSAAKTLSPTTIVDSNSLITTTRRQDIDNDKMLTKGALIGIIVVIVLLLPTLIVIIIIVICLCRRLSSRKVENAGNSTVQRGPKTYEMSRDDTPHMYETVQSDASAPAESTNTYKPPAPPRPSLHDITLVDNDLYQ